MDGAHERLALWRLRLAEFNYTVESRPGHHHHAADVMSRLATAGAYQGPIPDEIPALLTMANFSKGWVMPDLKTYKAYPPLTEKKIQEAQAKDSRCQ